MNAGRLRNEQGRQGHIDVGAIEIERIAGRDDQTDNRLGTARPFHLVHQARQCRFRRAGAQDQEQLGLQIGDQAKDRKAIEPGDQTQNNHHKQGRGQIETDNQGGKMDERANAVFADGKGKGPEGPKGCRLHKDGDEAEKPVAQRL